MLHWNNTKPTLCLAFMELIKKDINLFIRVVMNHFVLYLPNRPFPSSPVPLFQNESKCQTFHMKMSSACSFIFMQTKVIFIRMVSNLDLLWSRGTRELGNGPFLQCTGISQIVFWKCKDFWKWLDNYQNLLKSTEDILNNSEDFSNMSQS